MEDVDEIEDFYGKQVEDLDKEFIEKTKGSKDIAALEKEYKDKLLNIKQDYEKKISSFLKSHKSFGLEKEEPQKKEEEEESDALDMSKPFRPKGVSLKLTRKDFINEKWDLFKFNNHIRTKDFFNKVIPNPVQIFGIKIRFFTKRFFKALGNWISKKASKTGAKLSEAFDSSKTAIKNFMDKINKITAKIKDIQKKFSENIEKKKKEKEQKKEEEEEKKKEQEKSKTESNAQQPAEDANKPATSATPATPSTPAQPAAAPATPAASTTPSAPAAPGTTPAQPATTAPADANAAPAKTPAKKSTGKKSSGKKTTKKKTAKKPARKSSSKTKKKTGRKK
jgi:hypothetical protein